LFLKVVPDTAAELQQRDAEQQAARVSLAARIRE
jgi:hypothetical protein